MTTDKYTQAEALIKAVPLYFIYGLWWYSDCYHWYYRYLPEAFCRTLLRAFSTPGAPDVVAERILMGSWTPGPPCSPWFLQLSEKERATAAAFWESWITPDMQRTPDDYLGVSVQIIIIIKQLNIWISPDKQDTSLWL